MSEHIRLPEAVISAVTNSGRVYLDHAEIVSWLRKAALESEGEVAVKTLKAVANTIEEWKINE